MNLINESPEHTMKMKRISHNSNPRIGYLVIVMLLVICSFAQGGCINNTDTTYTIKIPVALQGAQHIGSLHLDLVYDPLLLTPTLVEKGEMAGSGMFAYSTDSAGSVVIGIVSNKGMNGDGTVAIVTFSVKGYTDRTLSLLLANVICFDINNKAEVQVDPLPGSFIPKDKSITPPSIVSLQQLAK